jgi:hypothetical protein
MATQKYGEISYNEDGGSSNRREGNGKDLFLRLNKGPENYIRLLTNPHQYTMHKIVLDVNNKKDYGQKVGCSMANGGSCPACDWVAAQLASGAATEEEAKKMGPKMRWLFGCIDRTTGQYKILDVSWAVFSQIKKHAQNVKHWGDPKNFDININVDPNAPPMNYYTVQTVPPVSKVLSAEDQSIKDKFLDLDDLKRRSSPPSVESVQKRMTYILGHAGTEGTTTTQAKTTTATPAVAAKKPVAKPTPKPVVVPDESDDQEDFPDYDQQ